MMNKLLSIPICLTLFALASCGQDAKIVQGPVGSTGDPGLQGPTGPKGDDGETGAPGPAASPNPSNIVDRIYPCGRKYADDEVLLVLADGSILMTFHRTYSGEPYLRVATPGKYVTDDRKHCKFEIHAGGTVTW
jgi:hypothetical protein